MQLVKSSFHWPPPLLGTCKNIARPSYISELFVRALPDLVNLTIIMKCQTLMRPGLDTVGSPFFCVDVLPRTAVLSRATNNQDFNKSFRGTRLIGLVPESDTRSMPRTRCELNEMIQQNLHSVKWMILLIFQCARRIYSILECYNRYPWKPGATLPTQWKLQGSCQVCHDNRHLLNIAKHKSLNWVLHRALRITGRNETEAHWEYWVSPEVKLVNARG
jgi:hypothetical protein